MHFDSGRGERRLPRALEKLVVTRCFDSWYGLAGLTPTEAGSLGLVSNTHAAGSVPADIPAGCRSHMEEQGQKAVQW